jgi:ParB/RepB/Spo0J family partition protein
MATKLNAGDDVKRGDLYMVDPFQIMVNEASRGRFKAPDESKIIEMAESMIEHGQQQPIQVRKIKPENKLQVTFGFTRTAAARLIRTGFTDSQGVEQKNEEFMLQIKVVDANEETAFINNIVENAHRNLTSPIDDAYNQKRLRDQMGKSNAEIARLYKWDAGKVGKYQDLLTLSDAYQQQIHDGTMPVSAAYNLLELPEDQRAAAIAAATNENTGKVVATQVASQVREHHLRDEGHEHIGNNSPAPVVASAKPLSVKELRTYWENHAENHVDPAIKKFAKTLVAFMAGKRAIKTMDRELEALLDAERDGAAAPPAKK